MIVNYRKGGWEIVTQRAHGLLAAEFALHWQKAQRPERWMEFLMTVAEHDDAQIELERDDVITEQGGPTDFKMRAFQLEHGERTLTYTLSKSRYIALLSATHLEFLAGDAKENKVNIAFFKNLASQKKEWCKELKINNIQLEKDYRLLEWCDALSLLICQHEDQPEERRVEISTGPDGKLHCLRQIAPGCLTVEPWPFEDLEFSITYEHRTLPQLKFDNVDEFKTAFLTTAVETTTWLFKQLNSA
ncbi:DUF3891 family protein [Mucilaginibacter terrenus]|uniref:DUF3891 family protein n=1 Tax=Mucilaginibacter terrenus TaxID=2482727 RepID=A0A3E2NTA6_9SPHI|nr:DUF3891 family protein [Mucilaginibacter terrenus]RFZ84238.1 DUF3891 family protein [Mucilaginibacter terrenus]